MKLSVNVSLAISLFTALLTLAAPHHETDLAEISEREIAWPGTAAGYRAKRGDRLTNGELLRRGMTPSRPRKLYSAIRKAELALEKRVLGAPAAARASGSATTYTYQGCSSGGRDTVQSTTVTLTYTSLQDLANKCAALDQARPAGATELFSIYDRASDNCLTSQQVSNSGGSASYVTCTRMNAAFYQR